MEEEKIINKLFFLFFASLFFPSYFFTDTQELWKIYGPRACLCPLYYLFWFSASHWRFQALFDTISKDSSPLLNIFYFSKARRERENFPF